MTEGEEALALSIKDLFGRMLPSSPFDAFGATSPSRGRIVLAVLCTLLASCSPLGAFDALVSKDRGSLRVAHDQRFAPGKRGTLDVYAPVGAASGLPVVVFFYGGSWNSGSKDSYGFAGRALAAQGFVTIVADYRILPDAAYPDFLEDCAAAVRWARSHAGDFGGDTDGIVLVGHSAGAYNAAMLALDPRWLGEDRKAVRGFAGLAGPYSFLPLDTQVTIDTFGKVADLPSTQPVSFASADDPPALLLAGAQDHLVFASNSVDLAMKLREAGAQAETRVYEDVGHVSIMSALALPLRGTAPVLADVAAFVRRVAGP